MRLSPLAMCRGKWFGILAGMGWQRQNSHKLNIPNRDTAPIIRGVPCTYVIDADNRLVITSLSDVVTSAEAFAHQNQLIGDPAFSPDLRQLIDCSQLVKFGMDSTELRAVAKKNFFSPKARRALLVNSAHAFGVGRMLITFRDLAGAQEAMQIFRKREDAMNWLLKD